MHRRGVGEEALGKCHRKPFSLLVEVLVIICTPSAFQYIVSLVLVSYKVKRYVSIPSCA